MKEGNFFIDTNVFLRVLVKDDKQKASDSEQLFTLINAGRIHGAFTSNLVLAEIVWTCLSFYKLTKTEVVKLLRGIISIKYIRFKAQFESMVAISLFESHNVKFIDALIASNKDLVAGKATIISYDKDFDILGINRIEPAQLIQRF